MKSSGRSEYYWFKAYVQIHMFLNPYKNDNKFK